MVPEPPALLWPQCTPPCLPTPAPHLLPSPQAGILQGVCCAFGLASSLPASCSQTKVGGGGSSPLALSTSVVPWVTLYGHSCLGRCGLLACRPRRAGECLTHSAHNSTPTREGGAADLAPHIQQVIKSSVHTGTAHSPAGPLSRSAMFWIQEMLFQTLTHIFETQEGEGSGGECPGDADAAPGGAGTRLSAWSHQTLACHCPLPSTARCTFSRLSHAAVHDLRGAQDPPRVGKNGARQRSEARHVKQFT